MCKSWFAHNNRGISRTVWDDWVMWKDFWFTKADLDLEHIKICSFTSIVHVLGVILSHKELMTLELYWVTELLTYYLPFVLKYWSIHGRVNWMTKIQPNNVLMAMFSCLKTLSTAWKTKCKTILRQWQHSLFLFTKGYHMKAQGYWPEDFDTSYVTWL